MRINFKKYIPLVSLTVLVLASSAYIAHAQTAAKVVGAVASAAGVNPWDYFWGGFANVMQAILTCVSWILGLTGSLLNVTMSLTTHLGPFINDTPVIYSVWSTIRDLSSMILIFLIIWAALQMILDLKQPNFGGLIKNIIIVGILINFSFFFARVMIDASNIVSLQFYNAIAPGKEYVKDSSVDNWVSDSMKDGGISNIFMSALRVNSWYQNKGVIGSNTAGNGDANAAPIRIVLVTLGGIIVMIMTSLSFLGAAAACILRIAMLIFLLAFSPVWIASYAVPQLGEAAKPWWKHFKAQLLFLPVYLLFMYVAIRILTESGLDKLSSSSDSIATVATQSNLNAYISLFVGFAIVIIMINVPLIAAVSVAGGSFTEKWFKGVSGTIGGWGRKGLGGAFAHTVGQGAYALNQSKLVGNITNRSQIAGSLVSGGLSKVSSMKIGSKKGGYEKSYEDRLKAQKKAQEDMHKRLVDIDKANKADKTNFAAEYRANLPYQTSILNHVIGRAHRETAKKLTEDADKKSLLDGLKTNKINRKADNDKLDRLMRLENPNQEQINEMRLLEEEIKGLDKKIEDAEEEKNKQNISDIIKGVKTETSKDDGSKKSGGGGEKKEEKPK